MKKTISTLVAVLVTALCMAQVPQKFNYQAIARTSTGEFVKNQFVEVEFAILDGGISGTEVYKEKHMVNTDVNGLISAQVGGGTVLSGVFNDINWSKGSYWLQTRLDAGQGYELLGAQELLSVPYALQANSASRLYHVDSDNNKYELAFSGPDKPLVFKPLSKPSNKPIIISSEKESNYILSKFNLSNSNASEYKVFLSVDGGEYYQVSKEFNGIYDEINNDGLIELKINIEFFQSNSTLSYKIITSNSLGEGPASDDVIIDLTK